MTQASEKICDALIEAGIDHVFGIPGGHTLGIFNELDKRQDKIKVILTRHEHAAACMADMYGRMTGKPGVVMGQGAWIASNAGIGIIEAFLYGSPMLVLTDTSDRNLPQLGAYQSGSGEYGSYDLPGIMRSMCKFTCYATSPEEAASGVQFAIKHAMTGKPGPASVVMRAAALTGEIDPKKVDRIHNMAGYLPASRSAAPVEDVDHLLEILLEAQRPVIIAGSGIHNSKAYEELKELAEALGIPVATSYRGKSAFPEVHPLALGMMGDFGQKVANSLIAAADLLLVVGCRLDPSDTRNGNPSMIDPSKQRIIQIDIEPRNVGWTFPVEMGITGDARNVLTQIMKALNTRSGGELAAPQDRLDAVAKAKVEEAYCEAPELYSSASPLLPQRIVKAIDNVLDNSALVTFDAGNNRIWMAHFFKSKVAGSLFCPGGAAGMGWGPPAALTAKLLHPDRPVLSVVGDGGFGMTTHVLSTAVQYNLPVVFLVMNNSVLGNVRDAQKHMMRTKAVASEFIDTDFAAIARAFGCQGIRVDNPDNLEPALKEAFQSSVPTVIDAITEPEEPFTKVINR